MTLSTVFRGLLILLLLAACAWLFREQQALHTQLAQAQGLLTQTQARVDTLEQTLARSRSEAVNVAVESLLLAAAERAQVFGDRDGALTALAAADARLAAAREPRFTEVRAAIADERAALAAVPRADRAALGLSLATLIERAPQWPLAAAPAPVFEAPALAPAPSAPTTAEWPARVWASFKTALSALFSLRRVDGTVRWQTPEQQALIQQILLLRLEGLRLTVLHGNDALLRVHSDAVLAWLNTHYKSTDAGVTAARSELQQLATQRLNPPLPTLHRSLERLRAQAD